MVCFPIFGKLIWFYFMLVLAEIAGHLCILILASKPILRKKVLVFQNFGRLSQWYIQNLSYLPPLMSLIGFQEMDTLGHFSIPFAAPKQFFAKWCTSRNLEPSNETFCKIWRKSNDQETNKVPRTLYHLSTPGHFSIFSKAPK